MCPFNIRRCCSGSFCFYRNLSFASHSLPSADKHSHSFRIQGREQELIFSFHQGNRVADVLGWPKSSYGFFHKILWKNSNEVLCQPNSLILSPANPQHRTLNSYLWTKNTFGGSLVAKVCLTLCNAVNCSQPGSSPWDFPGKNTGVGCHFPLKGFFLNQGSSCVYYIARGFFTDWATRKALRIPLALMN